MVTTPTRQNNILDLIFTSHPSFTERCKTLPPISEKSDHDMVLFDVSMQPVRSRPKRSTIFLWDKADIQGIKDTLATFRDQFMETNFQTVEQMWQSFKSAVDSAKDKYVPVRKTASRFTHPWIDTKLRRLAKRKIRAYKKAQRTGSPADWTRYRNLKTSTQRKIRTSHRNYMKAGMVTSDQKDKPKHFWSYVKAKKQESTGVAPLKNEDGFIHSNSQSKAEILNAQFQSVYTKEDLSSMPDKGPSPYPSMDSILFNAKGVHKQLSQLNSRKATGPDNISTAILRLAADELAPVLTRLYQFSHDQGTVPEDWRDAHIVLFLTYINDLPDCVASSETKLFADDSLLFRLVNSQQDADYLQKGLTALEKWEREWQMSFHPEKCTVIRMHASKKSVINTTYTLHNQVLQTTDSSKYLGVTLSDDLTWQNMWT